MKRKRTNRRGFTLIEILLVVLIIAMLAGVGILAFDKIREGARIDTTKAMLTTIGTALDAYNMGVGHYPTEAEGGLNALLVKPTFDDEKTGDLWRGPYLKQAPVDAWNRPFHYEVQDTTAAAGGASGSAPPVPYKLWSDGPDGQSGTADDIKNYTDQTTP